MFKIKLALAASLLSFSVLSNGQGLEELKVFDPVPINHRPQLALRLKLFVEYERTRQWDKLFDMIPKVHNQHSEETKEHFVKLMNIDDMRILDFVPDHTAKNFTIGADYLIDGCSKTRWKGKTAWYKTGLDAAFENGEWYFTPIVIVAGIGALPEPCESRWHPTTH